MGFFWKSLIFIGFLLLSLFGGYHLSYFSFRPLVISKFQFLFLFLRSLPGDLSFGILFIWKLHQVHFVLSLGAVIVIFSGIIFNDEKIVGSKNLLPSSTSTLSLYHLVLTFVGILLTFSPMHFLGFNVMQRRIPDFPDSFHSWN